MIKLSNIKGLIKRSAVTSEDERDPNENPVVVEKEDSPFPVAIPPAEIPVKAVKKGDVHNAVKTMLTKKLVQDDINDNETYIPVGVRGLMAASEKLLSINRGLEHPDDRDAPKYKRVFTPDKLLTERIRMDNGSLRRQIMRRCLSRKSLKHMSPFAFDPYCEGLIVGNSLSMPLEEINPLQLLEQSRRMTAMGDGGIGSSNAITASMQSVHAGQFGFVCPISGPESEKAGIDSRASFGSKIGSDGKIYQRFRNTRTGDVEWLSPDKVANSKVKIPG